MSGVGMGFIVCSFHSLLITDLEGGSAKLSKAACTFSAPLLASNFLQFVILSLNNRKQKVLGLTYKITIQMFCFAISTLFFTVVTGQAWRQCKRAGGCSLLSSRVTGPINFSDSQFTECNNIQIVHIHSQTLNGKLNLCWPRKHSGTDPLRTWAYMGLHGFLPHLHGIHFILGKFILQAEISGYKLTRV